MDVDELPKCLPSAPRCKYTTATLSSERDSLIRRGNRHGQRMGDVGSKGVQYKEIETVRPIIQPRTIPNARQARFRDGRWAEGGDQLLFPRFQN